MLLASLQFSYVSVVSLYLPSPPIVARALVAHIIIAAVLAAALNPEPLLLMATA